MKKTIDTTTGDIVDTYCVRACCRNCGSSFLYQLKKGQPLNNTVCVVCGCCGYLEAAVASSHTAEGTHTNRQILKD